MKNFLWFLAGFASVITVVSAPVLAQEVTLNSIDGSISMTGDLRGFDGETYTIATSIGEISISISQVTCEGENCPQLLSLLEDFTIAGSNTIGAVLLPTLIEAFALNRGGDLQIELGGNGASQFYVIDPDGSVYATITVTSGSSDDAFLALANDEAVIGLSSRVASADDVASFSAAGNGILTSAEQETIVALDGIIVVVNRDNPISALSLSQLTQIFAGEISDWSQLGGLSAPITLYRRDENSGTTSVFDEIAMAPNGRNFSTTSNILQTNSAVSDAVGRDINGIGISSIADERNARALAIRSVCGQIYKPSDFTIKTEEYPLSRRMYLYTKNSELPERAQELIDFISSETAQMIAENSGFVGQNVGRVSLDAQGRRIANAIIGEADSASLVDLQNLLSTVLDAERLSLTFRFISGTSTLDNRALGDIERLAILIRKGEFANREILVLGFTDSVGADIENTRLSQSRAEQVRDAIIAAAGADNLNNIQITPIGYGHVAPLGCNETAGGRETNRRVELWIK